MDPFRGRIAGTLAGSLALFASAGEVRAQADAPEPASAPVVQEIEWVGAKAVTPAQIAPYLFTGERPWWKPWEARPPFDPDVLDADVERIAAVYRDHGYYEARASRSLEWNDERDAVAIRIEVDEGRPVRLARWGVDVSELPGEDGAWAAELVASLPLRTGDVFTLDAYATAKQALLDGLANRGFPDATLSGGGDVDVARAEAVVWWTVHPGARVVFGEVRIEGLEEVSESLVRSRLPVAPGEVYSESALRHSRHALYELGLFLSALVAPDFGPGADDAPGRGSTLTPDVTLVRAVRVTLVERRPRSIRLGAGFGTEDKLRVQAGWIHRNVLGRADRLELKVRYSALGEAAEATLREPRLPDAASTTSLRAKLERETEPAYEANTASGRLLVERPLGGPWSGRVGYDVEYTDVTDARDASLREFGDPEGHYLLSFFELGLRRVDADDLLDPRRGTWLDLAAEPSAVAIGSDFDYVRWTAEGRAYQPLGEAVLAARALIGGLAPFGGTGALELPVTKLFYGGGSASVRGYGYQRLGNTSQEGDPVGGASLLEGSVELRFPIWKALRGVAFVDAGTLSAEAWTWRVGELLFAAGPGLRYSTPLGPLRLDAGFPLNPAGGVQGYRIWFSIGQAF